MEHGPNNVSRWMTWLPISLKNAVKCDKWYELQNHLITESLNANGAWEKPFWVIPVHAIFSVSNVKTNTHVSDGHRMEVPVHSVWRGVEVRVCAPGPSFCAVRPSFWRVYIVGVLTCLLMVSNRNTVDAIMDEPCEVVCVNAAICFAAPAF